MTCVQQTLEEMTQSKSGVKKLRTEQGVIMSKSTKAQVQVATCVCYAAYGQGVAPNMCSLFLVVVAAGRDVQYVEEKDS